MKLQDWTQLGWSDDGSNCWDSHDEGRHVQLVPEPAVAAAPFLKYKPNPHTDGSHTPSTILQINGSLTGVMKLPQALKKDRKKARSVLRYCFISVIVDLLSKIKQS